MRLFVPFSLAAVFALGPMPLLGSVAEAKPAKAAKPRKPATAPVPKAKKALPDLPAARKVDPMGGDSAPAAQASAPTRGPTRIDFDDRLIQGQTNASGAVYLYERKELKNRSMVKKRETFREEIVSTVYDP